MRAGKLIHRITIQEPVNDKGSMGGKLVNWSDFLKCRAKIVEKSGSEENTSEQIKNKVIAVCSIRYNKYISSKMRVLHNENIYQIDSVISRDGKKISLELDLIEFR